MIGNYLNVLEDSMQKKVQVLTEIQEFNNRQQELFQAENVDMSMFDSYVEEKGRLIEKVTALDEGFESLYAGVAEELRENREQYREQILRLQELVSRVTEMSVAIRAQEARNKKLVEQYFASQRSSICKGRRYSKAAYDYYKNMNSSAAVPPQFMDKKK